MQKNWQCGAIYWHNPLTRMLKERKSIMFYEAYKRIGWPEVDRSNAFFSAFQYTEFQIIRYAFDKYVDGLSSLNIYCEAFYHILCTNML